MVVRGGRKRLSEKTRKLLGALHRLPCMMSTLGVLPLPTILFFILCNSLFGYYLINVVPTFSSAWASAAQNIGYGILALGVFQVLQFVTGWGAAPTGKFNTGALALPVGLPVWLAWWTMEQPSVLVPAVALAGYFGNGGVLHPGVVYLGGMFIVHYIQRSFIYPFLQGTTGRDYPLHAWCFAMLFTACNGTMQANDLLYGPVAARSMADGLYANPRVYLGCAIWAFGLFCNVQADAILRNLRPPGSLAAKNRSYVIPRGGLFEYVSGAHFVGEIIEWSGYAIACWSYAPLCFAAFNWMGIGTRAIATHDWNVEKFGADYPKHRKRLIPFVW